MNFVIFKFKKKINQRNNNEVIILNMVNEQLNKINIYLY